MKKIIANSVIVILVFIVSCHREEVLPSEQITPPVGIGTYDDDIAKAVGEYNLPSLAAAVVKDGDIIWEGYYGFADIASQQRPDRNTIYYVSSVSKLITSAAVMQLIEQDRVSPDSSADKYLSFRFRHPQFPRDELTIRHLLTHKSGLSTPATSADPAVYETYQLDSAPPLFPWIKEYLTPNGEIYHPYMWNSTPPGRHLIYSNLGVAMLGYIVESVSGVNFADYCKFNIFNPLEMNNSGFRISDADNPENYATLYEYLNQPRAIYSVRIYPALSFRSSLSDLAKFADAILSGGVYRGKRVLGEAAVNRMLEVKDLQYGLSFLWWSHIRTDGKRWFGHTGSFAGSSSAFFINRESRAAIILLSNIQGKSVIFPNGPIYNLVYSIAQKYL